MNIQTISSPRLGKAEKFSLFTAVVGLIADAIALISIVVSTSDSSREVPKIVSTLMLLVLFYGWLVISWYIRRNHHLKSRKKSYSKRKPSERELISTIAIVTAIGILLLPMWVLWGISTEDTSTEAASALEDTNTAQNEDDQDNPTETDFPAFLWAPIFEALLGFFIIVILILGMPAIYDDMEWYWDLE